MNLNDARAWHGMASDKMAALLVPPLCEGMSDANPLVRRRSIDFLVLLGGAASPAIPTLRSLENDPDPDVAVAAEAAIEVIENELRKSGTQF